MTDSPGRQFERLFEAAGAFLSQRDSSEDEQELLRRHEPLRDPGCPRDVAGSVCVRL